jgi:phenylpropionate dioxygenase-like ring-hydroxylating dioxygenase large terminal subunit
MDSVRNAWYVAGWSEDLPTAKPMAMSILGEPLVLFRTATGQVVALEDRCVHRLAPLSLGRCEGERLRCMYHGMLYAADGKVVEIPGQAVIPPKAQVRSYPIVDRHSWLWVWMGDAARADATLIPPAVGLDDKDWILGRGHLDYAAEAALINDNLLDFTHLPYVHAASFRPSPSWATSRSKVTPLPRGVRFDRWIPGEQHLLLGKEVLRDRWSSYDFLIPGVLLMKTGGFTEGSAEKFGFGPPDFAEAVDGVTFTSQAVTPMQARSSRYFFSWGPHCQFGDAALRDILMGIGRQAFAEDKVMIEAQQKVIDATTDPQIMPTGADSGLTLFNQLVRRLARAEQAE